MQVSLIIPRVDDKTKVILMKMHSRNIKNKYSPQEIHNNKQKTAGMLVTESPDWDAPKPLFSIKTNKQSEKSGNQGQINHRNLSRLLNLYFAISWCGLDGAQYPTRLKMVGPTSSI